VKIAAQIKLISQALAPWAQSEKGSVKIAHDVPHLFKLLGENAGVVRAAILFAGEKPRNAEYSDVIGRVDREYWIAFSRGYTLESYAGKSLVDGIAGGRPMFDLIEDARTVLRTAELSDTDELLPYYHGTELLTFEGVTLDAYRIKLVIAADVEVDQEEAE